MGIVDLHSEVVRDVRGLLLLLVGAVGLVLLIGCADVANLLLAKASARTREIAIRSALGSTRARLVRQLLTESVLLGSAGGLGDLLLALWGVDLVSAIVPSGSLPRLIEARLSSDAAIFGITVSSTTGLWWRCGASRNRPADRYLVRRM